MSELLPCPFCGGEVSRVAEFVTCNCGASYHGKSTDTVQDIIDAWNTRQSSEWVSVEDRLPKEIIEFVLVSRDKGNQGVMEAQYIGGKFITYRFGACAEFKDPTHWMPLPVPPITESDDEKL